MDIGELLSSTDTGLLADEMYDFIGDLYPLCRSITGDGLRETLRRIGGQVPLTIHEVPTGTKVFDWVIPREWSIRDAYIKNRHGERVVDFRRSNLHVLNYSVPVDARLSLAELRPHLSTLPEHPDWVPYRTSYYAERWGFCLSHRKLAELEAMGDGETYDVRIDSTLEPGSLSYGELVIPGTSAEEVLVSCHACHPSLCNDNLSGIAVATFLARLLADVTPRYSYRFLFIPGTIGSITWLARNQQTTRRIRHGLVLANLGDEGSFTYKRSRRGDAVIDRAVAHVLTTRNHEHTLLPFTPYGYDERQYCSPGFDLPVGCFMRTPHGTFPEYHTSADDLTFVQPARLAQSLAALVEIVAVLEADRAYVNQHPYGEPQLGKRGLYRSMGGQADAGAEELPMLWTLNLSDGGHSLLEIAERSALAFSQVKRAADALLAADLLRPGDEAAAER